MVALIEHQLETIGMFKEYAVHRQDLTEGAEARRFSLPPADASDKILRYEAHFDRQLYRAMGKSSSVCNGSEEAKMCRRL